MKYTFFFSENDWHLLLANWAEWTTYVAPSLRPQDDLRLATCHVPIVLSGSPRSQSRLRYIADRVLQSSSDMFQKNKDEAWHFALSMEKWRSFPLMAIYWPNMMIMDGILGYSISRATALTKCCSMFWFCHWLKISQHFRWGDFLGSNLWIELKMFAPVLVDVSCICITIFDPYCFRKVYSHPYCWCWSSFLGVWLKKFLAENRFFAINCGLVSSQPLQGSLRRAQQWVP